MSFGVNNLFIQNSTLIATIGTGQLVFSKGRFDNWCIYHMQNNTAHAIKDIEVFQKISCIAKTQLKYVFYRDFCCIFDETTRVLDEDVIQKISAISNKYPDVEETKYIFLFLYAGMVAEENKHFAKIKKYMKRLGVHQVLVEGMMPENAANYSRGKSWEFIYAECEVRGFAPACLTKAA